MIATKLRKYFEKTKDKVLTIRNIRRHFGCYGFSDNLPRFYPPHTPYKQPPETRKPPLNPNHRKTHLQLIEKIAKFAKKY